MKNFKTDKIEEWYILTPNKVGGSITKTSRGLYYNDNQDIETFETLEDYESKCLELGIEINEFDL